MKTRTSSRTTFLALSLIAATWMWQTAVSSAPGGGGAAVRPDGAKQIPTEVAKGSLQNPCWSPDGKRLALTMFEDGYNNGGSAIWVVTRTSGRVAVKLTGTAEQNVSMPGACWDAGTNRIVFSSDPVGPDQAYVIEATGGTPKRVTRPPQVAWEPTFSPDGEWIVFESHKSGPKGEIWKVRVDGTPIRLTSGSNDRQPNWGPQGDLIVFQRHERGQVDLWVVDTDGDGERNVTKTAALEETDVSWSPSGEFLVFSGDGPGVDSASLFTIGLDGKGRKRLTTAPGRYDGAPGWSPDGKWIAFESYAGDPDGGPGTRLWVIAAPAGRR